jgi:hypothetical protein
LSKAFGLEVTPDLKKFQGFVSYDGDLSVKCREPPEKSNPQIVYDEKPCWYVTIQQKKIKKK